MSEKPRFGLEEIERQRRIIEEAQKPAPVPDDGFSRLGQALVNLPWLLLAIAFIIWWLKK